MDTMGLISSTFLPASFPGCSHGPRKSPQPPSGQAAVVQQAKVRAQFKDPRLRAHVTWDFFSKKRGVGGLVHKLLFNRYMTAGWLGRMLDGFLFLVGCIF